MTDATIHGSAEFSPCGTYRHRLDRWWSDGRRALVCGANPSDAGAEKNDPTIWTLIRLCRPLYAGFTMVNWQSYVGTDPDDMHRWRADFAARDRAAYQAVCDANLALIRALSAEAAIRIVAWGDLIPQVPHTTQVRMALSLDRTQDLYAFGVTKTRNPKHPMARGKSRIPDGTPPVLWAPAWQAAE